VPELTIRDWWTAHNFARVEFGVSEHLAGAWADDMLAGDSPEMCTDAEMFRAWVAEQHPDRLYELAGKG
jgi:hypothetical protein